MRRSDRLLSGPIAAATLTLGVAGLALMVPGYSHVRQTVSEIGEVGSPARVPFTVLLVGVAACLLVLASAVREVSVRAGRSRLAAYLVGCMGLSVLGVGIFAWPDPLHNLFGLSELIGYQAPLALALAWRSDPKARPLVVCSFVLAGITWTAVAVNLSPMLPQSWLWEHVRPVHGLAQRSLFLAWFAWCAVAGLLLWRRERASEVA